MNIMNYSDILQYFNTKTMKQDEAIELLHEELYSNNYCFMESIIEEYVLGLDETELATLIKTIRTANQSEG